MSWKQGMEKIENKIKESAPVHSIEEPETPQITSSSSSSIEPSSPENLNMESDLFHDSNSPDEEFDYGEEMDHVESSPEKDVSVSALPS